jgi:hypothetical protein
MKKLLTVILVAVLVLSLSALAYAAAFTFDFDKDVQGWASGAAQDDGGPYKTSVDTSVKADGEGSLKIEYDGGYMKYFVVAPADYIARLEAGQTVKFKFFIPADSNVSVVQPFIQFTDSWTWKDLWYQDVKIGEWFDVEWKLPADVTPPIKRFGILFNTSNSDAGAVYIDSIDDGKGPAFPAEEASPKTGYAGTLPFVFLAVASGAGLSLLKRKK